MLTYYNAIQTKFEAFYVSYKKIALLKLTNIVCDVWGTVL